ncbi:AI-2E family transporter [Parachitinimonas caeni]|uniref:AI-2E family transporter n=1 Tax=Parachitinimonas caeni TaxID=3031301 RepID=A0ABT7DWX0_9NEIS|nr:AI-2E family transporter [Parachitinimonas caeni]MDK2124564.1 AI-2E family transporter [Parachitinimonas caeni]
MSPRTINIASYLFIGLGLVFVMFAHLLPSLLAGLLVVQLVDILAPLVVRGRIGGRPKLIAVAFISSLVVIALTVLVLRTTAFFRSDSGSLPVLMVKLAEIIDGLRGRLPEVLLPYLPADVGELKSAASALLRQHAGMLGTVSKEVGLVLTHILVGMVLGALVALHEVNPEKRVGPLAQAITERLSLLSNAFRDIVFAQVQIAAVNTFFTWLFLGVALPLFGIHLPMLKVLIAVTFFAGLVPVLGNLISNTVIVIVSLSISFPVAIAALTFLVVIHKVEYFLNARIVGSRIQSSAWELLTAMLLMEAAFGLAGVVAAPIYYAYMKRELMRVELI